MGMTPGTLVLTRRLSRAKEVGYWSTQARDVREHVHKCLHCQSTRPVPLNANMGTPPTDQRRFEIVYADYMPMPATDGHTGAYVFVDSATGYTIAVPTRDKTADSMCIAINTYIALFDAPKVLHVDMGSEGISAKVRELCEKEGITLQVGSAHNHQSSGMVETKIKAIKIHITHNLANGAPHWLAALPAAIRTVNNATQPNSRRRSARALMLGVSNGLAIARRFGLQQNYESPVPRTNDDHQQDRYIAALAHQIDSDVAAAGAHRAHVQQHNADYHAKHGTERNISVGAYVFIANNGDIEPTYLQNKRRQSGPFRVLAIDDKLHRAQLLRLADNTTLKTWIAFNRLQVVDADTVNTPVAPSNEPGAGAWQGARDSRLLLSKAQEIATSNNVKQLAAETAQRLHDEQRAARSAARTQEELQRQRALADQRAAAERQRQQFNTELATAVIPDGAVPTNSLHHTTGAVLSLSTDPTDPSRRIFIGKQHPRFAEFERLLRLQHQQRRSTRRAAHSRIDRLRAPPSRRS